MMGVRQGLQIDAKTRLDVRCKVGLNWRHAAKCLILPCIPCDVHPVPLAGLGLKVWARVKPQPQTLNPDPRSLVTWLSSLGCAVW